MWLVAQQAPNYYMIPLPGGSSVHVVVPIAGAVCLTVFVLVVTVLTVLLATRRRNATNA